MKLVFMFLCFVLTTGGDAKEGKSNVDNSKAPAKPQVGFIFKLHTCY